jgi:hypothetical protein
VTAVTEDWIKACGRHLRQQQDKESRMTTEIARGQDWCRVGGRVIQQFPGEQEPPRHGTVVALLHQIASPQALLGVKIRWDGTPRQQEATEYNVGELGRMHLRDPLS